MAKEEGHWITIEGRHIFIRDGESIDSAVKRAWGVNKDEDQKDKQIEANKKQADELNREKKRSDGTKKGVSDSARIKMIGTDKPNKDTTGLFSFNAAEEYSRRKREIEEAYENWKKYQEQPLNWKPTKSDKQLDVDKDTKDEEDWPPKPTFKVYPDEPERSEDPDENGLYDVTDQYWRGTDFKDDLFKPGETYITDRTTRFVAGVHDNAQEALDVLADNAQGIFIDCPGDTVVKFTDSQGRTIEAKAREDRQGRISWTVRIDNKRSGSGWASRDLAEMLSKNPKDFSLHIPHNEWYGYGGQKTEQQEVNLTIKDGKVSKTVKSKIKPVSKYDNMPGKYR